MRIGGLIRTSLVDYPGKVAAVIFTQGCNFRCPYCHNPELVIPSCFCDAIPRDEVISYLQERREVLEGVVVSGGEPTLQKDLGGFLRELKAMGYAVKLDTNGSRPRVLQSLIDEKLVDFIAMDIKSTPEKYNQAVGVETNVYDIRTSVDLIQRSGVDHLFRTTVVQSVVDAADVARIAGWVKGDPYRLQEFVVHDKILDPGLMDKEQMSREEFERLQGEFQHN